MSREYGFQIQLIWRLPRGRPKTISYPDKLGAWLRSLAGLKPKWVTSVKTQGFLKEQRIPRHLLQWRVRVLCNQKCIQIAGGLVYQWGLSRGCREPHPHPVFQALDTNWLKAQTQGSNPQELPILLASQAWRLQAWREWLFLKKLEALAQQRNPIREDSLLTGEKRDCR